MDDEHSVETCRGLHQSRLKGMFKAEGVFGPPRACFRQIEESVIQTGCLLEVAHGRTIMVLEICLLFLDLKKAYDTISLEALRINPKPSRGEGGDALGFIRGLYAMSMIIVRSGRRLS